MKRRYALICPTEAGEKLSPRFSAVLSEAVRQQEDSEPILLSNAEEAARFFKGSGKEADPSAPFFPVLFAVCLGEGGINLELERLIRMFRTEPELLLGCVGGILVDGDTDLYTKSASRRLCFAANQAGCAFIGRPMTEGTGSLSNFGIMAKRLGMDLEGAYCASAAALFKDVLSFRGRTEGGDHFLGPEGNSRAEQEEADDSGAGPRLLVLHSSLRRTSNTLALWQKTADRLAGTGIRIRELSLQNGTLYDCAGCPYRTCMHYGEQGSCFYGGVMAEEVYPAVRRADAIMMLCANYNDALSANLTAFINRLTALFRQVRFYDKALFALVVSGYSGSDLIAEQLIGALNMNKTFYLPPHFALMVTANDAGTAVRLPGIDRKVEEFAGRIRKELL